MLTLEQRDVSITIDPDRGGRIASLRVHGLDVLVTDGPSPLFGGAYPMAP